MTYAFIAPQPDPRRPHIRLGSLRKKPEMATEPIAQPAVPIALVENSAVQSQPNSISTFVRYAPPWRIDYSPWKPDQPPRGWESLVASFTNGRDVFVAYPDELWTEQLAAQPDMINAILYLRYQAERTRRETSGQPADHSVPIYSAAISYRRRYIRSPASFAELVTRKRQLRRENRKGHYQRWGRLSETECAERNATAQLEREQRQAAAAQAQAAQLERTHRSIKRWANQGLSRNAMVKRLGGDRNTQLRLIGSILDLQSTEAHCRNRKPQQRVNGGMD